MGAGGHVYLEDCHILRETKKAYLVGYDIEGEVVEKWMPKSVIADADDYSVGDGPVTLGIK